MPDDSRPKTQDPRSAPIASLRSLASAWLGTPWCANSSARGRRGGVACHNLPRAILMETGLLPADFPEITGDPTATRHSKDSVMAPWLDARPEFVRIPAFQLSDLQPGDLLGLRIYHCIDHLGLFLGSLDFIHVLMHKHAAIDSLQDPTWSGRLLAIWRPRALTLA